MYRRTDERIRLPEEEEGGEKCIQHDETKSERQQRGWGRDEKRLVSPLLVRMTAASTTAIRELIETEENELHHERIRVSPT